MRITATALKVRMFDEELAVCAIVPDKKLIGIVVVNDDDLGETKELQVSPGREVEGTIKSSELDELEHDLDGTGCYVFVGDERPFLAVRKMDAFAFYSRRASIVTTRTAATW